MPSSTYFLHFKFLLERNVEKVENTIFRNKASQRFETINILLIDILTYTEKIQSSQGCF